MLGTLTRSSGEYRGPFVGTDEQIRRNFTLARLISIDFALLDTEVCSIMSMLLCSAYLLFSS